MENLSFDAPFITVCCYFFAANNPLGQHRLGANPTKRLIILLFYSLHCTILLLAAAARSRSFAARSQISSTAVRGYSTATSNESLTHFC